MTVLDKARIETAKSIGKAVFDVVDEHTRLHGQDAALGSIIGTGLVLAIERIRQIDPIAVAALTMYLMAREGKL